MNNCWLYLLKTKVKWHHLILECTGYENVNLIHTRLYVDTFMKQYHNQVSQLHCSGATAWTQYLWINGSSLCSTERQYLYSNTVHSPCEEEEGSRGYSFHNTRQVLIAARLLKVNVILTFQSLSLIAFSETLTASACNRGTDPRTPVFRLHAKAHAARAKVTLGVCECFCSPALTLRN